MKEMNITKQNLAGEIFLSDLDERFLEEAMKADETRRMEKGPWVNIMKIAACLALVVVVCFSSLSVATAAGSLRAYELLYALDPYLAEKMSPVMESCVDQGIEMKVAGIYVHGDIVDIYVTMQDLEGNRIDGTTDLFDSYSIHTNLDQWGGCSLVAYDEGTHTASFLITAGLYGKKIEGKKMTFSVSKFLSKKQEGWFSLSEIDLARVVSEKADARTVGEVLNLINSATKHEEIDGAELEKLLVPNDAQTFAPVQDGAKITAYGMVDGRLHVQVYYEDIHERDDHGDIQLVNQNGENVICSGMEYFWDSAQKGRYVEYEFDVPADELSNYGLVGYFSTGAQLFEGNWKISFPIVNQEE